MAMHKPWRIRLGLLNCTHDKRIGTEVQFKEMDVTRIGGHIC